MRQAHLFRIRPCEPRDPDAAAEAAVGILARKPSFIDRLFVAP
jgi:hypothetical protein